MQTIFAKCRYNCLFLQILAQAKRRGYTSMLQLGSRQGTHSPPLLNALPSADSETDSGDEDALSADEWKVRFMHPGFAAHHSTLQGRLIKHKIASLAQSQRSACVRHLQLYTMSMRPSLQLFCSPAYMTSAAIFRCTNMDANHKALYCRAYCWTRCTGQKGG